MVRVLSKTTHHCDHDHPPHCATTVETMIIKEGIAAALTNAPWVPHDILKEADLRMAAVTKLGNAKSESSLPLCTTAKQGMRLVTLVPRLKTLTSNVEIVVQDTKIHSKQATLASEIGMHA